MQTEIRPCGLQHFRRYYSTDSALTLNHTHLHNSLCLFTVTLIVKHSALLFRIPEDLGSDPCQETDLLVIGFLSWTRVLLCQCFNNNSGKATIISFDTCSNSLFIGHSIIPIMTVSFNKLQAMKPKSMKQSSLGS
jgi:hypothetical protein